MITNKEKNIYTEMGFKDRDAYINSLAYDYNIDAFSVFSLADMLGESEDFDGLVSAVQDFSYSRGI